MWVYFWRDSVKAFVIGFYSPNGDFLVIETTGDDYTASERVHYLNGGDPAK